MVNGQQSKTRDPTKWGGWLDLFILALAVSAELLRSSCCEPDGSGGLLRPNWELTGDGRVWCGSLAPVTANILLFPFLFVSSCWVLVGVCFDVGSIPMHLMSN